MMATMNDADETQPDNPDNPLEIPWCVKYRYVPVFRVPNGPWKVDASWDDAYFDSAKTIVQGVVEGHLRPAIEGVAGVYLFRHYLEIALKYVIFHARWLKDATTNAPTEDIEDVKNTHNLDFLWQTAESECQARIPKETWASFDIQFARRMVLDFHSVDQRGVRFRYHGEKFGIDKRAEHERVPLIDHLWIDYPHLLAQMQHARDVLWAIDV
jgi:hypothetical protein